MEHDITTREGRIQVVNLIIKEIATTGRKFFQYEGKVSTIYQKNNRLYMINEYNGIHMGLSTKYGYPPKGFTHGGTIWGLTKDFKEFIMTGDKSNGENGYGGLYSVHWGYPPEDMVKIRELAKSLSYL